MDSNSIINILYLIFALPICFIGLGLNFYSYRLISKIEKSQKKRLSSRLYSFIKMYQLNSSVMCLMGIFSFYIFSPKFITIDFDYLSRFFRFDLKLNEYLN
jgi:hypothetical protein